jgi:hypothetical protein
MQQASRMTSAMSGTKAGEQQEPVVGLPAQVWGRGSSRFGVRAVGFLVCVRRCRGG